jgi:hypothetical protein
MSIRHTFVILIIGVVSFRSTPSLAEDRIWLDATINDKPVHLAFDSGSTGAALCPQTVQKLGLKFIPSPTNALWHGFLAGNTEDCNLTFEGRKMWTSFLVLDVPAFVEQDVDFDGLIGWYHMSRSTGWFHVSRNILRIDAVANKVESLSKVPTDTAQWARFSVLTNFGVLDLLIPHGDHSNGVVCIDTGWPGGFALNAQEYREWKESHPQSPRTLETNFDPEDGFYVTEEAWADQISIGPTILTGVPISVAGRGGTNRYGAQYEGTIGMAALKRLNLIVDSTKGVAYLRARTTPPPAYNHNHLGAIFSNTTTHTNQAVAWVVHDSPAYEAGVRNGDILLQVDEITIRGWTDDWRSRFYMPAGTKLKLTLQRDGKIFTTTATLREILQPSPSENK